MCELCLCISGAAHTLGGCASLRRRRYERHACASLHSCMACAYASQIFPCWGPLPQFFWALRAPGVGEAPAARENKERCACSARARVCWGSGGAHWSHSSPARFIKPPLRTGVVATSASETLRAVYIIYGLAPQLGLVAGVCRVAVGVPRRCFVFQLLRADVRVP